MVKQLYYRNMQCVVVQNQNLLKKQEASGILSSVGIRTPLNKIPVLGDSFFKNAKIVYKNNDILLSKV